MKLKESSDCKELVLEIRDWIRFFIEIHLIVQIRTLRFTLTPYLKASYLLALDKIHEIIRNVSEFCATFASN